MRKKISLMRAVSLAFGTHTHRQTLPKLLQPVARALSVPASSAPVERVFSQGGSHSRYLAIGGSRIFWRGVTLGTRASEASEH